MRTPPLLISLYLLGISVTGATVNAQESPPAVEILPASAVKALFTDSIRHEFKITYPIFRVYKYVDKSGSFLCVLTESNDRTQPWNGKIDTLNSAIKAVDLRLENNKMTKVWELNDHILQNDGEHSIWFWASNSSFKDLDGDGLVEPIIVYGTFGPNGYDDGRVKFIIYYKGKKYAIRHQSSTLDGGRETDVDAGYDSLPKQLHDEIDAQIENIQKLRNVFL
jgi:hypothetical protein